MHFFVATNDPVTCDPVNCDEITISFTYSITDDLIKSLSGVLFLCLPLFKSKNFLCKGGLYPPPAPTPSQKNFFEVYAGFGNL